MITRFDRPTAKRVSEQIEAKLADFAKENGLVIEIKGGRLNPSNVTFKLEVATTGENGEVNSKEAEDFKLYCSRYDLKESDLGKTFSFRGDDYEIVGCKPKSWKRPILGKQLTKNGLKISDGETYKFEARTVHAFNAKLVDIED